MIRAGSKMRITLEQEDGVFYELDALNVELSQRYDYVDTTTFSGKRDFLATNAEVEMHFVGVGDITTGLKRTIVVCVGCGSEWHDDKYHLGTCGNCGWGAGSTKKEVGKL